MSPQGLARLIGVALLIFVAVLMATSGTYVVHPGFRGVKVTLGKVSPEFMPDGFGLQAPFITKIHPVSIQQQSRSDKADCYSSDLQQIVVDLKVLFKIPEPSIVKIFQGYETDVFTSLISPRVQEALKEVTALQSAEQIVKNREQIKISALALAKQKVGTILVIDDIVIENLTLTRELEQAIEQKMVQEQEAAKAKFLQERAEIEAQTFVIKAKGEAESIRLRGTALMENPSFVDLQIVDRWDGRAPAVVGGGGNVLMTLQDLNNAAGTVNALPAASAPRGTTTAPRRNSRAP